MRSKSEGRVFDFVVEFVNHHWPNLLLGLIVLIVLWMTS